MALTYLFSEVVMRMSVDAWVPGGHDEAGEGVRVGPETPPAEGDAKPRITTYELHTYAQPLHRYLHARVYNWWSLLPSKPIKHLDPIARWWHKRRCNGRCATMQRSDGTEVQMCGFNPPSFMQDLKAHEIGQAGRELRLVQQITRADAEVLGWRWDPPTPEA